MRLYKIPKLPLWVAVQLGSKRFVCHPTGQALVKALIDDASQRGAVAAKCLQELSNITSQSLFLHCKMSVLAVEASRLGLLRNCIEGTHYSI